MASKIWNWLKDLPDHCAMCPELVALALMPVVVLVGGAYYLISYLFS